MNGLVYSAIASAVFLVLAVTFALLDTYGTAGDTLPLVVASTGGAISCALLSLRER